MADDNCPYTFRVRFEWDRRKARANMRRTVSRSAKPVTVLEDDFGLTRDDPAIVEEPRFVTLGLSNQGKPLVIVYTHRELDVIRVISAWPPEGNL